MWIPAAGITPAWGRVTRKQMDNDDLTLLKDDMTAFIEGHGMRRFPAYVSEDMTTVMWEPGSNPDSWKDFVEVAKASGVAFMTMNAVLLDREDVDFLTDRLKHSYYSNDEDLEESRWLKSHIGKTGFVQLGYPYQGIIFLFEVSTDWYDRYQRLLDLADDVGMMIDEPDQDDEH
jgi:hypothetical protein